MPTKQVRISSVTLTNASYAVFFLAEDFRSHFLFMDGTVLGSECDLNGLFCIEGYELGDSISDFARQLIMWIMI